MFFETCSDCGRDFLQYAEWQVRCYRCYKQFKDERKSRTREEVQWGDPFSGGILAKQPTTRVDKDGIWLRANIKALLHLCHPDKHGGSEQSSDMTRELIKIFKRDK